MTLRALNYTPETGVFSGAGRFQRSTRVRDVFERIGPAYGTIFTRFDCEPAVGEALLDQASMFASEPIPRWIRGDVLKNLGDHRVEPHQVLVAGAGTLGEHEIFGRSVIADDRLAGSVVGPDALALWPASPGSEINHYSYAFLASPTGVRCVRSTAYGTKILRLNRESIANLPIPLGTDEQVQRVAIQISRAVDQRNAFRRSVERARALLHEVRPFREAESMCRERRPRCVRWRGPLPTLTAWTFASAGGALHELRSLWGARLADVVGPGDIYNGHRFARVACRRPHGVDLYSQRDVFMARPVPRRVVHPGFEDKMLMTEPGMLLTGGAGTLGEGELFGRVEICSPSWSDRAISEHLLRIRPSPQYSSLAFAFLSSRLGFRLLRTAAVGTKILSLRPDLLRELPFPDVDAPLLTRINHEVSAALASRDAADAAESEAIRIIEEEVLPAWLA